MNKQELEILSPLEYPTNQTKRPVSEGAEKWLGVPIKCLDRGFVYLVDYMGNDQSIEQAARVSYGAGTRRAAKRARILTRRREEELGMKPLQDLIHTVAGIKEPWDFSDIRSNQIIEKMLKEGVPVRLIGASISEGIRLSIGEDPVFTEAREYSRSTERL